MDAKLRIVTEIPIRELWDDNGPLSFTKEQELCGAVISEMLKISAVRFVFANLGDKLKWIPVEECYVFWKSELKQFLADEDRSFSSDFTNDYVYTASRWKGETDIPIILVEMHH